MEEFTLESNTDSYDGFTIKFFNMASRDTVCYSVRVVEEGKTFYRRDFSKDIILSFKANKSSTYRLIINNDSDKKLTGNVKINSYKKYKWRIK